MKLRPPFLTGQPDKTVFNQSPFQMPYAVSSNILMFLEERQNWNDDDAKVLKRILAEAEKFGARAH